MEGWHADYAAFKAHFDALNEHLQEIHPIMDDFCSRNGFAYVDKKSLGRYPRIRIEKLGPIELWFDLWMELDKDGRRFERFSPDLPYELSAGAHVIVEDGSAHGTRFQKSLLCFSGKPFERVGAVLKSEMEKYLCIIKEWDAQYLIEHGDKVKLGR
jgi:hypothetical protein